jgi:arylsulfatase B
MPARTWLLWLAAFLVAALPAVGRADAPTKPDHPNILLIVADDLGWNDVSYHGSEIKTPVLDRLAKEGVQLDRFYVYPTCSPTRACLLSGRNAARYGILGPLDGSTPKLHLPLETKTLPKLLKERGYTTGLVGKWHLGGRNEYGPLKQGFDSFYGYLHGQVDQYSHVSWDGDPIWLRGDKPIEDKGHATDLFAREASAFLRQNRDRPFFLELAFSVPHYPLQDEPEWLAKYESIADKDRRTYAAMVSHMDDAIGKVLAVLDETKLRDNTLVLFTSDNGGQQDWNQTRYKGQHGPYKTLGDNRPLRGWKGSLYEGGVRVVALAHWPGRLKPGVLKGVADACDFYPTIAGLTGAAAPESLHLDGIDLWPALVGKQELPPRTFWWNVGAQAGILDGDYKLIRRLRVKPGEKEPMPELYNLVKDPLEKENLAAAEPKIVSRLRDKLDAELQKKE